MNNWPITRIEANGSAIHVRQIQPVQVAANGADAGNQPDQDGRVSGPIGVRFHCGVVDEALLKIIQIPSEPPPLSGLLICMERLPREQVAFPLPLLCRNFGFRYLKAYDQNWTQSVFEDFFGIAAEQQVFPTGVSMRR